VDVLKLAALAVAASTPVHCVYFVHSVHFRGQVFRLFAVRRFASHVLELLFSLQLPQHRASSSLERNKMNFPNHILLDAEIAKRRLKESLEPAGDSDRSSAVGDELLLIRVAVAV
jgi:hypothetical protein